MGSDHRPRKNPCNTAIPQYLLTMTIPDQVEAHKGLMKVSELAEISGRSEKLIRTWINKRGLPVFRDGSNFWLDPHAVAEWLRDHTVVRGLQKRH